MVDLEIGTTYHSYIPFRCDFRWWWSGDRRLETRKSECVGFWVPLDYKFFKLSVIPTNRVFWNLKSQSWKFVLEVVDVARFFTNKFLFGNGAHGLSYKTATHVGRLSICLVLVWGLTSEVFRTSWSDHQSIKRLNFHRFKNFLVFGCLNGHLFLSRSFLQSYFNCRWGRRQRMATC